MSFLKGLKWVSIAMFFCGILLNNLPIAHADVSSAQGDDETADIQATTTYESSIDIEYWRDSHYEGSEETDEFGNEIFNYSETSNFPLVAMIKSENIYLYGIGNNYKCESRVKIEGK